MSGDREPLVGWTRMSRKRRVAIGLGIVLLGIVMLLLVRGRPWGEEDAVSPHTAPVGDVAARADQVGAVPGRSGSAEATPVDPATRATSPLPSTAGPVRPSEERDPLRPSLVTVEKTDDQLFLRARIDSWHPADERIVITDYVTFPGEPEEMSGDAEVRRAKGARMVGCSEAIDVTDCPPGTEYRFVYEIFDRAGARTFYREERMKVPE